jgi:hypothetical protein
MSEAVTEDILGTIGMLSFRFAKTMPEQPHEYTVRKPDNEAAEQAYVALYYAIQQRGVRQLAPSGKCRTRYLYPGDGFKYWAMTTAVWHSRIITRAKVTEGPAPASGAS